jgi:hypothetical protein
MPLCNDCVAEQVRTVLQLQHNAAQRGALMVWTMYDHPKDYPDGFIARRFEVNMHGDVAPTDHTMMGEVDDLQEIFRTAGLVRVSRQDDDDPVIVETWI